MSEKPTQKNLSIDQMAYDAAKRFIRNVAVIDNDMTMDASDGKHSLNADVLTKAFSKMCIACAVYKPLGNEAELNDLVRLVRQTDATVLDWQLRNDDAHTPSKANEKLDKVVSAETDSQNEDKAKLCKDVIKKVLEDDCAGGNPLRLIVIYTGETYAPEWRDDLADQLKGLTFSKIDDGLNGPNFRIIFREKVGRSKGKFFIGKISMAVEIEELPSLIVQQFAELSRGLLPSAVLHGLSALREGTNGLIGIFNSGLDPAMVLHAMMITASEEAPIFLSSLLSDECRSILEDCEELRDCISVDALRSWLELRKQYFDPDSPEAKYEADKFSALLTTSSSKPLPGGLTRKRLLPVLYGNENWWDGGRQFCRLTTLRREAHSANRCISESAVPKLTQGTILKNGDEYLICIIPRCDSSRITDYAQFPFVKCKVTSNATECSYSIALSGGGEVLLQCPEQVRWKTIRILRFNSNRNKVVQGKRSGLLYVFVGKDDKVSYEWVAELKDHLAAKLAADLAPGLHRIGINEFEWLRNAGGESTSQGNA